MENGKTVRGIRGVSREEEKEGYAGKHLQKRKDLSLEWKSEWVTDDESGESMEPMEEVPFEWLGESELEKLVRGWRRVDFRDEGKHNGRNDLLFVEKMMWMDERVWPKMKSEFCEEAELWWGKRMVYSVCVLAALS